MLTTDIHKEIAEKICECFKTGVQLPLLSTSYPELELSDSYAIQQRVVSSFLAHGRKIRGYKIGLTSIAVQEMLGATEPGCSAMLDHMFIAEDSELAVDGLTDPLVEVELAFVMKDVLKGPDVSIDDVIHATDFVLPAIEIVDFRVARAPGMDVRDNIADLAAFGRVVLGRNAVYLHDIDVQNVGASLLINGEVKDEGISSAVLGNPLKAVAWLANRLSGFNVALKPGDVILSGSFFGASPVQAGDEIVAQFGGEFGKVAISFT
jgi:2-oxo-hept-3-ene-1,7-dioate hydratase/2-keto-4-pentenoate hydratase